MTKKSGDIVLPDVGVGDVLAIESKEVKEKYTQFRNTLLKIRS